MIGVWVEKLVTIILAFFAREVKAEIEHQAQDAKLDTAGEKAVQTGDTSDLENALSGQ